jgi:hypothetical protein
MKKYISLIVTIATLGSLALAMPAFAQQAPGGGQGGFGMGMGRMGMGHSRTPAVFGTVSAINADTLTVTSRHGFGPATSTPTTTTTYTVDAANATVTKNNASSTLASIAVGDTVLVQGTISGTNVTATIIRDGVVPGMAMGTGPRSGKPAMRPGFGNGIRGTVSAISGTTLTVTGSQGFSSSTSSTTYTVDASNATVNKNGQTSTVSAIAVGDTVMVQGTISGSNVTAKTIRDGMAPKSSIQGNGEPVVAGSVTAINGNTITITNKSNITYTIDATNAKFSVKGVASPTISNVAVGDNLVVQGTVNGTSVTASSVIDQKAAPTSNTSNKSGAGITGGISHLLGGVGNFFKHIFGF